MFKKKAKKNTTALVIVIIILTTLAFGGINQFLQKQRVERLENSIDALELKLSSAKKETPD